MPAPTSSPNPQSGHTSETVLGDRYSLTSRIAIGGMGQVWAATDTVLGRQVAVKILRDDLVDSPVFLERFRAEARHTAALAHPGIANVFDYGEDRDGDHHVAYLVMELVPGRPLSKLMSDKGVLPVNVVLSVLAQTAEALHAAHLAGVVHRDVKPGNLLLLDDGTIKVTDFGIARAANSVALTEVGQVIGTARYISPEQAIGAEATPASDIYSLGVIGYEMLAGHPPFIADNAGALAMAHVHQPPPSLPPDVPTAVRAAITAALAKDPADRPADARAFAATLRRLQLATMPPPGEYVDLGEPTVVMTHVERALEGTRLMLADDGSRTAIMPPGGIVERPPDLGVSQQAYAARRQRRTLGVVAVAVVVIVLGLVQLGGADSPSPLFETPTTTPAAAPIPTVAPLANSTTIASTTTTVAPKEKGKGNGKDKPRG
jgi:eukaryotic-like serine/threonine-protein kinase